MNEAEKIDYETGKIGLEPAEVLEHAEKILMGFGYRCSLSTQSLDDFSIPDYTYCCKGYSST